MIGAFLLLTVPLCPLGDAYRGITHAFYISIPFHWRQPGYHTHILHLYTPSLAFAGASHTLLTFLYPLTSFHRGITHAFGIPMPSQWRLPGHQTSLLHCHTLSPASFQTNIRIKFKFQVINYTLQIVTYRFQITDYNLHIANHKLQPAYRKP